MKNILIILLFFLFTSFNSYNDAKEFHIRIVGIEEVEKFEAKFPQIVNSRHVYVAYLGKYYRGNEDAYCLMLKR